MTDVVLCRAQPPPQRTWSAWLATRLPLRLEPEDRVYVVIDGVLAGYSIVERIEAKRGESIVTCREGFEPATLPCQIKRFRSWRYRWWDRAAEREPSG